MIAWDFVFKNVAFDFLPSKIINTLVWGGGGDIHDIINENRGMLAQLIKCLAIYRMYRLLTEKHCKGEFQLNLEE